MKRLIIDARALEDRPLTGVGKYTENFLHALDSINGFQFTIFAGRKYQPEKFLQSRPLIRNKWPSKITMLWWSLGWSLPEQIHKDDIFVMTNLNYLPSCHPKSKLIVMIHDLSWLHYKDFFSLKSRLWHRFFHLKKIVERAHYVICVSESTKKELLKYVPHSRSDKIKVIYPGVEHIQTSDGESKRDILLYLATNENRKNVASIVRAWSMIHSEFPELSLMIVGKPGHRAVHDKSPRVEYRSYCSDEERAHLYARARLFIWPSFYEGFGFPLLEAEVAGVPTIASFSTSLPEIMKERTFYVNPWNAGELAEVIRQALSDPIKPRPQPVYNWEAMKTFFQQLQ